MGLADNPRIVKELVNRTLKGESTRQIAPELGVDHATVARTLRRPVVRQLLEKAYLDLASLAPDVYKTYQEEVTATPNNLDEHKLRLSATKDVAGMIGLSPVRDSHNNIFFMNIIAPTSVTLSPIVAKMLDRLANGSPVEEEVIDVEFTEEES